MNISVHILKHLHVKNTCMHIQMFLSVSFQTYNSFLLVNMFIVHIVYLHHRIIPPFSSDLNWSMNKLFLNKMIHVIQTYFSLSMNVYFLHIYLYVYLFSHESQVYLSLYIRSQRASIVIPYTENTSRVTFFNHELPGTNKICD